MDAGTAASNLGSRWRQSQHVVAVRAANPEIGTRMDLLAH